MENQMYLTPSQVEELRELGVEFEDTVDVWIQVSKDKWERRTMDSQRKAIEEYTKHQGGEPRWAIPCPDLQKVLGKLPKVIEVFCDEDCSDLYYLTLSHICSDYWSVYYLKNSHKIEYLANYSNANPLLAAFEMLCYVAKNHPESLTDKTEE